MPSAPAVASLRPPRRRTLMTVAVTGGTWLLAAELARIPRVGGGPIIELLILVASLLTYASGWLLLCGESRLTALSAKEQPAARVGQQRRERLAAPLRREPAHGAARRSDDADARRAARGGRTRRALRPRRLRARVERGQRGMDGAGDELRERPGPRLVAAAPRSLVGAAAQRHVGRLQPVGARAAVAVVHDRRARLSQPAGSRPGGGRPRGRFLHRGSLRLRRRNRRGGPRAADRLERGEPRPLRLRHAPGAGSRAALRLAAASTRGGVVLLRGQRPLRRRDVRERPRVPARGRQLRESGKPRRRSQPVSRGLALGQRIPAAAARAGPAGPGRRGELRAVPRAGRGGGETLLLSRRRAALRRVRGAAFREDAGRAQARGGAAARTPGAAVARLHPQ